MLKRIISILIIITIALTIFQINVKAASVPLGSVEVNVTKENIKPGEEVTVNILFGTPLGAYTFDVAYDNSIFEYVKSEGGTENDNGTRVRVTYYDSTGGTNPRESMSVTFKAKADLESTNPTDFSVTAEGLANSDASQTYDDITNPIKKSVTVEPKYEDYTISLNYTGKISPETEKEMKLITASAMGRNYDHVKMQVEVTKKPSDSATVKLLATERTRKEVDLIQDGWGDPDGYELGGKDVEQILDIRGVFSEIGEYTIKISLVDKDNSDALIAEKEINIGVEEKQTSDGNAGNENNGATGQEDEENNENNTGDTQKPSNDETQNVKDEEPETLPKTGMTKYVYIITIFTILISVYIVINNIRKKS